MIIGKYTPCQTKLWSPPFGDHFGRSKLQNALLKAIDQEFQQNTDDVDESFSVIFHIQCIPGLLRSSSGNLACLMMMLGGTNHQYVKI